MEHLKRASLKKVKDKAWKIIDKGYLSRKKLRTDAEVNYRDQSKLRRDEEYNTRPHISDI